MSRMKSKVSTRMLQFDSCTSDSENQLGSECRLLLNRTLWQHSCSPVTLFSRDTQCHNTAAFLNVIPIDLQMDGRHIPLPLATITAAFNHLKHDVEVALRTQLGDAVRLKAQIQVCSQLRTQIAMVSNTLCYH
jgi:hypothetical protein